MVSLGIWACRYREMQPISFGAPSSKTVKSTATANGSADSEGHVRGGQGPGTSLESGSSYEMANLTRADDNV